MIPILLNSASKLTLPNYSAHFWPVLDPGGEGGSGPPLASKKIVIKKMVDEHGGLYFMFLVPLLFPRFLDRLLSDHCLQRSCELIHTSNQILIVNTQCKGSEARVCMEVGVGSGCLSRSYELGSFDNNSDI